MWFFVPVGVLYPLKREFNRSNSIFHGQRSISYQGPLVWQLIRSEFKDLNTVSAFKTAIRKWNQTTAHAGYVKYILEMLHLFKLLFWS